MPDWLVLAACAVMSYLTVGFFSSPYQPESTRAKEDRTIAHLLLICIATCLGAWFEATPGAMVCFVGAIMGILFH